MENPNPKSVETRALDVVLGDNRGGSGWYVNAKEAVAALSSANLLRTDADERVLQAAKAWVVTCELAHSLELRKAVDAHPTLTPPAPKPERKPRYANGGLETLAVIDTERSGGQVMARCNFPEDRDRIIDALNAHNVSEPAPKLPVWSASRPADNWLWSVERNKALVTAVASALKESEARAMMRALADARDGAGSWTEAK